MTVKHTQGPWAIYVPKSLSNDDIAYGIDADNGIKSESVVLFYGGILKKEDARLIAAAPALLTALEALADYVDERAGDNECRPLENARAAIAKATGKDT